MYNTFLYLYEEVSQNLKFDELGGGHEISPDLSILRFENSSLGTDGQYRTNPKKRHSAKAR